MSIALPPLPDLPHDEHGETWPFCGQELHDYATAYALAAVEAYIASGVPMTDAQVAAYGTASVEADRASRVPMTDEQCKEITRAWSRSGVTNFHSIVRDTEAHHGIGGKS